MKRLGNIYDTICSTDNLYLADKRARKGKANHYGIQVFDRNPDANILLLHESLINKTFKTSEQMTLFEARTIAQRVRDLMAPHCERIEIAGSIRRQCAQVGDIEIVAIPKPYDTGLFENGVASVINKWQKVKGELEYKGRPGVKACRYTQRLLPEGIAVDIFFADRDNWGYILAIRTGSAAYSKTLAQLWKHKGYQGADGYLRYGGRIQPVPEEADLFNILKIPYCAPEARNA